MSDRRRLALLVVVLVQLAVPLGMAGLAEADLAFGEEIRLRARPLDPLDVFRGNYVVLTYDISSLQVPYAVQRGQRLCANLFRTGAGEYSARYASDDPSGKRICGRARDDAQGGETVGIEYGIETYYANAERARKIESEIASGELFVVVDLDEDGSARIAKLEFGR
ncbi:MAG: GDYXXLXY domain-containing protein [Thermoleophilia bacterium]|nr:GDYXXLXY domain-containing protein [Thermoleophilia bacterium]